MPIKKKFLMPIKKALIWANFFAVGHIHIHKAPLREGIPRSSSDLTRGCNQL